MSKNFYTRLFFATVLLILLGINSQLSVSWVYYILLVLAYVSIAGLGSYFIQLNFFLYSYCKGETTKKQIALTFDDGPFANFTPQILDILKVENVSATFFLIGKNVEGNENLLLRMLAEGHVIGSHSFNHAFWFSMQGRAKMVRDLLLGNKAIHAATGKYPSFFRPPYGVTNPTVAAAIKAQNLVSIGWSVRTYDTNVKSAETLLARALKNLENGDIILFHDWGKYTIDVLPLLITQVKARGFNFVSMDKLIGRPAYNDKPKAN